MCRSNYNADDRIQDKQRAWQNNNFQDALRERLARKYRVRDFLLRGTSAALSRFYEPRDLEKYPRVR